MKSDSLPNLLFVTSRSQVSRLRTLHLANPGLGFVAGSKSLERAISETGLKYISSDGGFPESRQREALDSITALIRTISTMLAEFGVRESWRHLVERELLQQLSAHQRFVLVAMRENADGMRLINGELASLEAGFGRPGASEPKVVSGSPTLSSPPFLPVLNPFSRPYVLDMRANNARTDPQPDWPRFLRMTLSARNRFHTVSQNTQQAVRSFYQRHKASRIKLLPLAPHVDERLATAIGNISINCEHLSLSQSALRSFVLHLLAELTASKATVDGFLNRFGQNLKLVVLDSPANPLEVALAHACLERGIETVEESHGCMVIHGGELRERASAIMASSGNNWTTDVRTIVPRSPVQAIRAPENCRIVPVNRVKPQSGPSDQNKPFRILLAPNFFPWHMAIPALTATCHETLDVAKFLAGIVARRQDWQLDMRIKVTTADTPGAVSPQLDRGLLPYHVDPLADMGSNIRNASADSYSRSLEEADLVVSEGVTSVMIEALEYRTPVLLLNRSKERIPSMPAARLADMAGVERRFAVYASSTEEDCEAILQAISRLHKGRPLRDDEIGEFCWLGETALDGHYLQYLL
ncbi:MAG: hypothetical protein R3D32_02060 [Nitratireductor sp.]